ncbi:uracil-DNA glycosylase [Terracidiphilus gabretensis]|uniref:uracil-DNA glycosylase n=1 Tax=Terracidiphilus gabretensis TaxID=1577687 RepID=UPI00071BC590|nr:uracil-DNA glycosylase [Terracidiphilus gabretensis]
MAAPPNANLDSATRQALATRLRFYRDLGLVELYRRPVDQALLEKFSQSVISEPEVEVLHEAQATAYIPVSHDLEETAIPPRKPIAVQPEIAPPVAAQDRAAALQAIREDIGDCTRCALHKGRNKIVFADGSPDARLLFVGEGPGADEDAQGLPFVGKAGQLLNNMIGAMGLKREEVYICNVVKCRPPGNRTPEPVEANTCSPFLFRQIDVVRPEVIVALGATAATYLLGQRQPLAGLRGRVHAFRGSKLIVTYHPAFLLRDPRQKKEAWADLQIAMRELGLTGPQKG